MAVPGFLLKCEMWTCFIIGFIVLMLTENVNGIGTPAFPYLPKTISLFENRTLAFNTVDGRANNPSGSPLKYGMVTSPPGGPFTINNLTGEITVPSNPGFDYENIKQYSLAITVDDGNQTNTETLMVNIINVNEKPIFTNLPGLVHIPEDTLATYILYNLLSTDPEGDPVTYSLISPTNGPFTVLPSGAISLNTNPGLDYETRPVYRLKLEVKDHELYSTRILDVIVDDVNEPPEILNMGVTLTLPRGTLGPIYYVQGYDQDLNEDLKYTFTSEPPSAFGRPFVLNPATGELSVNQPPGLDPSVTNLYTLNVTLKDKEGFTDSALLTIRIVDITDVPEIWNLPSYSSVKETETHGLKIFHARTIDMTNGNLTYTMTVSPDENKFTITPHEGEVYYRDNPGFDYETTKSYEISVTVTNGKKISKAKSIFVRVRDMNEPPQLDNLPDSLNMKEDTSHPAIFFKVIGSDQDVGTTLTYNMSVNPPEGQANFRVDPLTGDVWLIKNLDYETTNYYAVRFMAFDGELLSKRLSLRVYVENVNEPPYIPERVVTLSMKEEELIGYQLPWNCTAADEDKADSLTYQLVPTADSHYFSLNTSAGCALELAQTIDSEDPTSPESADLMIRVTDKGGLAVAMRVTVDIINVNEHAPVFFPESYLVHVVENEDVDAFVVSLNATDLDAGRNGEIVFNMTSLGDGSDYFQVSKDGEVTVAANLDREDLGVVSFDVVASDLGAPPLSATASVTVVVLEENDNRPVFLKRFYDFECRYDADKETVVGIVTAVDPDKPTKILEYVILGVSHEFEIVSVSGVIQTKQKLIPNLRYLLYVQAQDMGDPKQSSEAVGVRIDTYVCEESVVRMDVYRQPSFFDANGRLRFSSAMSGLFPGFVARVGEVRAGKEASTSEVLVHVLRNNSTGSATTIYNRKDFVPVEEILKWTTYGSEGDPVAYLSSGAFTQFPVTKVTCECCVPDDTNWWLETTEGQVTTGILSTIGAGLLLAGLTSLGMYVARKLKQYFGGRKVAPPTGRYATKPPISTNKPQAGGNEINWWKLQPKAAFDENAPLEEKYRPPSRDSVVSKGSAVKSTDVRAELTAFEQQPDRSMPAALRPKPANARGLWF